MREIKFRCWEIKERRMLVDTPNLMIDGFHGGAWWQFGYETRPINDCVLMQYSGFKDRNSREIYEDDLIKTSDGCVGRVQWRKYGFEQNMINTLGWWVIQEGGEVVGNVWENPELSKLELLR